MKDFKEILEFTYEVKDDFYIKDIRVGLSLTEEDFARKVFKLSALDVKKWEQSNYKLGDLSSYQRKQLKEFVFSLENFLYKMIYGDDSDEIEKVFNY
jgi:hypothetical protein